MSVYVYARQSTNLTDSIPTQVEECKKVASSIYGDEHPAVFLDTAVSGSTSIFEREGLKTLIESLEAGDVVIAYDRSRLARSLEISLTIDRVVRERGASLHLCETGALTADPSDQFQQHILGALAEFQLAQTRSKVKQALAYRKAQGFVLGRPRAFCRRNKDNTAHILSEYGYRFIITVNTLRHTGLTWAKAALKLNELGFKNTKGNDWKEHSLRQTTLALRNEFDLQPEFA